MTIVGFMLVFGVAVVAAVATYARKSNSALVTYALRAAPYFVGLAPAAQSWHTQQDPVEALGWALMFLALTWAIIWSVKKQWGV